MAKPVVCGTGGRGCGGAGGTAAEGAISVSATAQAVLAARLGSTKIIVARIIFAMIKPRSRRLKLREHAAARGKPEFLRNFSAFPARRFRPADPLGLVLPISPPDLPAFDHPVPRGNMNIHPDDSHVAEHFHV
jgi:hypothetical protein